ncbi:MAG: hypothetical protein PHF86_00665 [Candidatus Nanoarchaeia archaeon]|nr:hypothetical protein [Candidatus Nanoarchaeia archaeon]
MKAKFINELQNFEREGSTLDKLDIGKGPEKYISIFEKILKFLDIETRLEDMSDGSIVWDIINVNDTSYIHLIPKGLNKNSGWYLPRKTGYEKDPFNIINILIERKYGNTKDKKQKILDKIKNLQSEFDYLSEIENKIEEINNTIKEYKN